MTTLSSSSSDHNMINKGISSSSPTEDDDNQNNKILAPWVAAVASVPCLASILPYYNDNGNDKTPPPSSCKTTTPTKNENNTKNVTSPAAASAAASASSSTFGATKEKARDEKEEEEEEEEKEQGAIVLEQDEEEGGLSLTLANFYSGHLERCGLEMSVFKDFSSSSSSSSDPVEEVDSDDESKTITAQDEEEFTATEKKIDERRSLLRDVVNEEEQVAVDFLTAAATAKIQSWYRTTRREALSRLVLQNAWRGKYQRRKYRTICQSIVTIQRYLRGYNARCYASELRRHRNRETRLAATKIQSVWRVAIYRNKLVECRTSAILIQKIAVGKIQRAKYVSTYQSIVTIQRFVKGYNTRCELLKEMLAASQIQSIWRTTLTRTKFVTCLKSAILIQKTVIGKLQRTKYDTMYQSIEIIQRYVRGFHVRFMLKKFREEKEWSEIMATTTIQSRWRMARERRRYLRLCSSARSIQEVMRSKIKRLEYSSICLALSADEDGDCIEDRNPSNARQRNDVFVSRPWRRDVVLHQAGSYDDIRETPTNLSIENHDTHGCADFMLLDKEEHNEFYLPLFNDKELRNPEDPFSLENILRPWQVDFLAEYGICRMEQLVKAHLRSAPTLLSAMQKYRKKHNMRAFSSKSCSMALSIWANSAGVVARSIHKQLKALDGTDDGRPRIPNTRYILSSYI